MHIEFIGLPGSGKTTLHKEAIKLLNDRVSISRKEILNLNKETYLAELNEFIEMNREFVQLFLQKRDEHFTEKKEKDFLQEIFFFLFVHYNFCKKKEEIILFDEGFCHRVISLFFSYEKRGIDREGISLYVDHIPLPDLVFFVKTDKEKSYQRMLKRKKGFPKRLKNLKDSERKDVLKNSETVISFTIHRLKEKSLPITTINNNGSLHLAKEKLWQILKSIIH